MDVRTRIVLGMSCRIGIDFPFSRGGIVPLFPRFRAFPVEERRAIQSHRSCSLSQCSARGPWGGCGWERREVAPPKVTDLGAGRRHTPVHSDVVHWRLAPSTWLRTQRGGSGARVPTHLTWTIEADVSTSRRRLVQRRRTRTGNRAIAPRVDRTQKQHAD